MKRVLTTATMATIAALMLAGCTTEAPVTITETAMVTTQVVTPDAALTPELADALFLQVVKDAEPAAAELTDADMINLAHAMCVALDDGADVETVVIVALNSGIDMDLAATINGAGIAAYCPEYTDLLQ